MFSAICVYPLDTQHSPFVLFTLSFDIFHFLVRIGVSFHSTNQPSIVYFPFVNWEVFWREEMLLLFLMLFFLSGYIRTIAETIRTRKRM
ncbi:hypothetical protein ASPWEDRAFT_276974 [Aspergillus wentii DTO 134E9]|uniref:Uncharacterized protein n=1 Tax=Aspergillus wentii DTO 134E9 TaxID=1073089 RepID=A0A1L9S361_ASPWE|nr:uncharacterized protein ASPWEDRAFT_276974 [Aspergillus wentii DTO 134E9]OJJ41593.1 hypothetical protein ASPWEDRAFT_276974 [Aspergillus wentii DTO 134E9]